MLEDTRYKTFWRRVGANLLDGLIIGFVAGILLAPVIIVTFVSELDGSTAAAPPDLDLAEMIPVMAAMALVTAGAHAYTIFMLAKYGQTVGKMATGIVVRDAETLGAITFRQAFMRSVGEIVLQITYYSILFFTLSANSSEGAFNSLDNGHTAVSWIWWIAELVSMVTNPRRRALHDFIAVPL